MMESQVYPKEGRKETNGGYNVDWINGNDGNTDFFLDYVVGSNANVWIGLGFSIDNTMVS